VKAGKHWKERNKKGCARLDSCIAKKYAPKKPGELRCPLGFARARLDAHALIAALFARRLAGKLSKSMQAVLHARVTRAQSMAKAFAKGGDRGQCAKNPLCVRGLDHGGRPGYCTLRGWALNEDDDEEEDGEDEPSGLDEPDEPPHGRGPPPPPPPPPPAAGHLIMV
jgi:hypothetical protein